MRVEFVRQLTGNPELLARFGSKPQPIARAVGLSWPDAAREIVKQRARLRRERPVRPQHRRSVRTRDLHPGAGRAAAISTRRSPMWPAQNSQRDQRSRPAGGTDRQGIAGDRRDGRVLWRAARPGRDRAGPDRLRREISGECTRRIPPAGVLGRSGARSRSSARISTERSACRLSATWFLCSGRTSTHWSAKAIPRAMAALLPTLDPGQASEAVRAMPPAIAMAAVAKSDQDNAYLLALMQVVETLARHRAIKRPRRPSAKRLRRSSAIPNEPLPARRAGARGPAAARAPKGDSATALL